MARHRSRRPLRIAYPVTRLHIGGAELRALSLVERLPRDQFDVHFLSLTGVGPLDDRARSAGARVHHLGEAPLWSTSVPNRIYGRAAKLARYIRLAHQLHFDIIDAWLYPTDVVTALARTITRTPIIVTGRADLLPRRGFGPLSGFVDVLANRRVDAIVANSQAVAQANSHLPGVDPRKLYVILNGVQPVPAIHETERADLRSRLGATDGDILIGSVGMLREVKRHSLLIGAFARTTKELPEARLAIVGEGPERPALERQIEGLGLVDKVALPGAVTDIRPLYGAFDVVAMSSRSEGLPNALLEAAAAGRPIVTTAAGGAVETVLDGETGVVVPKEDELALANALLSLSRDPERRARLGNAGRQHVASAFGMDRFVGEWIELYQRLADEKGIGT